MRECVILLCVLAGVAAQMSDVDCAAHHARNSRKQAEMPVVERRRHSLDMPGGSSDDAYKHFERARLAEAVAGTKRIHAGSYRADWFAAPACYTHDTISVAWLDRRAFLAHLLERANASEIPRSAAWCQCTMQFVDNCMQQCDIVQS